MLVPQRLYPLMLQNHRGEAFRETLCLSRCLHCDCIAAILQPRLVLSSFRWWLMDVSMGTLSWNTTLSETVLLLFTSVMLLCMGSFHRAPDHLWLVKPRGIFAQVGGLTSVSWPNSSYDRMELSIYILIVLTGSVNPHFLSSAQRLCWGHSQHSTSEGPNPPAEVIGRTRWGLRFWELSG